MARLSDSPAVIKLARQPSLRLGTVEVHPATRQVTRDGRSVTLEPRVMQVLVALARAQGAVLTRDELIESCWGGVVVGENAIQRVISRIRDLAEQFGPDSFDVETITKVGYRMVVDGAAAPPPAFPEQSQPIASEPVDRRRVIAGSLAAGALGGLGLILWTRQPGADQHAAALALYEKGAAARQGGSAIHTQQAIAFFREATRLAPDLPEPWGGLALAFSDASNWGGAAEAPALAARSRSAARRALELDPSNADARTALILLQPLYRNWATGESVLRGILDDRPEHPRARGAYSQLLLEVGRSRDSATWFEPLAEPTRFIPLARYGHFLALWHAGRLEEAETALDNAWQRWPKHGAIWEARVWFLAHTGRAAAALALAEDEAARPVGGAVVPSGYEPPIDALIATVRALQSGRAGDRESAGDLWLGQARRGPAYAQNAIEHLASLGHLDAAFAVAAGYFLKRGAWAGVAVPLDRFQDLITAALFSPLTPSMRRDPRFGPLVKEIGLEDYWRSSGLKPDFRR